MRTTAQILEEKRALIERRDRAIAGIEKCDAELQANAADTQRAIAFGLRPMEMRPEDCA